MRTDLNPDNAEEAASAPVLRIRLFGGLDLGHEADALRPVGSTRARSLLGYLVLHPDVAHVRQRLAFLLWPDSTEAQARTNLRNVLHLLRRGSPEVEPFLDVSPTTLQWRGGHGSWVDAAELTAALERADAAGAGTDGELVALRTAVELYTGDLLDGCYDEWVIEVREDYRDRYVGALRRLTEALSRRSEHAEAIRIGRQLVRADRLNEDHHRLLMRVHDAAGDRAGALRVYHECAAVLQSELGVEPSSSTRDAFAQLLSSDDHTPAPVAVEARGIESPLVGRTEDWGRLTRCWDEAAAGQARLVVVSGEPGVGKTRLVEEVATWCEHRGAVVGRARSYRTEGELGYGVITSWLRTDEVMAQIGRADPSDTASLARLLPEVSVPGDPAPVVLGEAEQRRRLFEAVSRVLLAPARPVLLVADDAQWCDAPSLQLIHFLLQRTAGDPVMVVITARREELSDQHPLLALLAGLQADNLVTELPLDRLSRSDAEALAGQLARRTIDPADADHLYAETEGNPLFIVESIRAGWAATGGTGSVLPTLSPKLQAVIDARLRQLSEPARDLLALAATVGRSFTAELLGAAAGVDETTLVRGLDELWRRGVIREHDADAYDFSHGKIREVAYDGLSRAARRRAHRMVAEALRSVHAEALEPVSGQVAVNYDRAGRTDDAITWYQRAAAEAQRLQASEEAVQLLERAHELATELPEGRGLRRELDVVTALQTPLGHVDGFTSSRLDRTQERGFHVAAQLGIEPGSPLLRALAMSKLSRDDFPGTTEVAERLRSSAAKRDDDVLLVESDYILGVAAFWAGSLDVARAQFERVIDGSRPGQRAEHLERFGHDPLPVCMGRLANTLWFLGREGEAARTREAAVALSLDVAHPFSRGVVLVFSALLTVDLGEHERLRGDVAALADWPHPPAPFEIPLAGLKGYLDVLDGRTDAGIASIWRALDIQAQTHPAPGLSAVLTHLLVEAHVVAGEAGQGLSATDDALQIARSPLWEADVRRRRAEFLVALGAPSAEVEAELTRAGDVARRQGASGLERRVEETATRLRSNA